jgi:hypothetical protein
LEPDDGLRKWLDEDQVQYDAKSFDAAIQHLEWAGRIKRPRQDQWNPDLPLPGDYVPPRIYNE